MSAWSVLTGNSTAPNGSTAWVHLQNQQGGTGGDVYYVTATTGLTLDPSFGASDLALSTGEISLTTAAPSLSLELTSGGLDLGVSYGNLD